MEACSCMWNGERGPGTGSQILYMSLQSLCWCRCRCLCLPSSMIIKKWQCESAADDMRLFMSFFWLPLFFRSTVCHSLLWQFSIYIYFVCCCCCCCQFVHFTYEPCVYVVRRTYTCDGYDLSYLINVYCTKYSLLKNVRFAHRFSFFLFFFFVFSIKPFSMLRPNKNKYEYPEDPQRAWTRSENRTLHCNDHKIHVTAYVVPVIYNWYYYYYYYLFPSSVHTQQTLANAVRDWTAHKWNWWQIITPFSGRTRNWCSRYDYERNSFLKLISVQRRAASGIGDGGGGGGGCFHVSWPLMWLRFCRKTNDVMSKLRY